MNRKTLAVLTALNLLTLLAAGVNAQKPSAKDKQRVRTVTIPISIFTSRELRTDQAEEFVQADRLIVKEDQEEQTILSIRSVANSPLSLAVLIQDDLSSEFNGHLPDVQKFIRGLPKGTRVMVAYLRSGTIQIRQRFTDDLDRAASSIRILGSSSVAAANGPYEGVVDALRYFDGLPGGRRSILLVSDGLDASQGVSPLAPMQSTELERAILNAQRKSVAVYSIFSPGTISRGSPSHIVLQGQGGLERLSDQTGGRAFIQGTEAPVSIIPFLKDLTLLLNRQFALTYLSTHMKKGYHRVQVTSTNPEVKIEHPKGYYYR
ncbi:MAG: hypothetical protein ACK4S4_09555 [Pyrinomonadaceae bacterium]